MIVLIEMGPGNSYCSGRDRFRPLLLEFGWFTFAFIGSEIASKGLYDPGFSLPWLFLWASVGLAFILGLTGALVSAFRIRTGCVILLVGGAVGLVAYLPYYQSYSEAFRLDWLAALLFGPWWASLMVAGGLLGLFGKSRAPPGLAQAADNI